MSKEQIDRVTQYIELGAREGARVLSGGGRESAGDLAQGYFVQPTVFADVRNDMRIAQEEIFGPVVSVIPFKDVEDVIRQGNHITYGLGAGVWTGDLQKAHKVAAALRAGTVWINTYNLTDSGMPFGGFKQSGVGREMGFEGIELYTEVKSVWVNLGA